ncbi:MULTISPECIES: FMN-dependent NADH-azoreductase [unclassified Streptomyces]|uniref:FMN-dependent NADH-azoreductase n=1 Tax=unclassified Streptomyces TaxID=2593676 RepID=UPI002965E20F|nr:NAD(P)H-dependent oxidoreductase [Streptomyces sp. SJL17-1]
MTYLLHIDSSAVPHRSVSRDVAATFLTTWQKENPELTVVHRDLTTDPLPHLTPDAVTGRVTAPGDRTEAQAAAIALQDTLIEEFHGAGAYLFTVPMYNNSVPSAFKAWIDQVFVVGRVLFGSPDQVPTRGRRAVVIASRGGGYGPGSPREGMDHVTPYLKTVLGSSLGLDVEFVTPELTMAPLNPAMASLVPLAEASLARAHEEAEQYARQF